MFLGLSKRDSRGNGNCNPQVTDHAIHGSPGHVIRRPLYLRSVAERLLLRAFLYRLVFELYASTGLSAFVSSPMPSVCPKGYDTRKKSK